MDTTTNPDSPAATGGLGVTGTHTTAGRPHGFSSLTPFLAVPRAAEAVAFYRDVLGARVVDVTEMGGVVVHAELAFEEGKLQIGEPSPDYGLVPPPSGDAACCSLALYVPDLDAVLTRAVSAGAVVREPAAVFVSGDYYASIRDPFGVRWTLMSRVEDLSEKESAARVATWAAEQAG